MTIKLINNNSRTNTCSRFNLKVKDFGISFSFMGQPLFKTEEKQEMEYGPYANIVGNLMMCTRRDLAHALSVVSRYMLILPKHISML